MCSGCIHAIPLTLTDSKLLCSHSLETPLHGVHSHMQLHIKTVVPHLSCTKPLYSVAVVLHRRNAVWLLLYFVGGASTLSARLLSIQQLEGARSAQAGGPHLGHSYALHAWAQYASAFKAQETEVSTLRTKLLRLAVLQCVLADDVHIRYNIQRYALHMMHHALQCTQSLMYVTQGS